jgi:hypothetical protein
MQIETWHEELGDGRICAAQSSRTIIGFISGKLATNPARSQRAKRRICER